MKINYQEIWEKAKRFFLSNIKIVVPVAVIALVALIVVLALGAGASDEEDPAAAPLPGEPIVTTADPQPEEESIEAPLVSNTDEKVDALFRSYYECLSNGDTETLLSLCDVMEDKDLLRLKEYSNYLSYEIREIYTQPGPVEDSYIAYVYTMVVFDSYPDTPMPAYNGFFIRTREDGSLYIYQSELTEEENAYISSVASFDEVVQLNNVVNVEYNELVVAHPEILSYISELDTLVNTTVGEQLAAANSQTQEPDDTVPEGAETDDTQTGDGAAQEGPEYVTATTKVNVRASDSENADKLGQVTAGTKLELIEKLSNGWSKVVYGGVEGYIKSEYLSKIESAEGISIIGTVTTTDTVNVRATPSKAGEKVGVLAAGENVSLVERKDGWCKIVYGNRLAYIIEDYVQ
ncbi:MAG: SH3 domain-containing protein [Lachnospiraceae bacterium]|nr:SH3 domain-containing protein [Lachnospiraceae bacterium]